MDMQGCIMPGTCVYRHQKGIRPHVQCVVRACSTFLSCSVYQKTGILSCSVCFFYVFFFFQSHARPWVKRETKKRAPLRLRGWRFTIMPRKQMAGMADLQILIPLWAQCVKYQFLSELSVFFFGRFFENFDVSSIHTEHESVFFLVRTLACGQRLSDKKKSALRAGNC